jgi:hypothetical protein
MMLKILKHFTEREQRRADLSATLLVLLSHEGPTASCAWRNSSRIASSGGTGSGE